MKKLRTILAAVLVLVLSLSLFAGCGASNDNGTPATEGNQNTQTNQNNDNTNNESETPDVVAEVVELEFWTFWGSEFRRPLMEKIVEDFNNSQDGIHVTHVFLPWGDVWTKNIAQIAAGNPPDVIVNHMTGANLRAEEGQVENLLPFIESDVDFNLDEFLPEFIDIMKYEDGLWALPFVTDTRIIYYNKDQFRDVGLDPENPPQTWSQLKEAAYQLDIKNTDGSYERMGFHPTFGNGGLDTWISSATQGVMWYDNAQAEVVIDTPERLETLEWMIEFTDHYGSNVVNEFKASFSSGMQDPFISGKLSMMLQTPAFKRVLDESEVNFDYGVMLIPEFKSGTGHYSNGGGFAVEIPKGAKNPEASYEFIKYMAGRDAQKYWGQMNYEMSTRIDLLDDEDLKSDFVYAKALESLPNTSLGRVPLEMFGFNDFLNPVMDEVFLGSLDPAAGLKRAEEAVRSYVYR